MTPLEQNTIEAFHTRVVAEKTVDLRTFLREHPDLSSDALAEIIEVDGRAQIARNLPVDLDRYRSVIPDLPDRLVALDAALDMALRSLSAHEGGRDRAAGLLLERHPDLGQAIREAVQLGDALRSVDEAPEIAALTLPCDIGPPIPDGRTRYCLLKELGRGAQGQVLLAEDRLLSDADRPAMVAVKILGPSQDALSLRGRRIEEATKARRVDHPNVVRVLDRGVTPEGADYVVYEYVAGGDLAAYTKKAGLPLPLRDAAKIVANIARGLQAAHSAGLVHCDLKPSNVMFDGATCKVADFGTAVRVGLGDNALCDPRYRPGRGNIAFTSPEQFRSLDHGATIPSDIYALGGILFYLATGRLPKGTTLEEVAQSLDPENQTPPPSMRKHRPEVDADLDAICTRALANDLSRRHQSAGELADDLERWLNHEPIPWTRPNIARRSRLAIRRHPRMALLSAVLVLIAVSCAGLGIRQWLRAQEERIAHARDETRHEDMRNNTKEITLQMYQLMGANRGAVSNGPAVSSTVLVENLTTQWAFGPSEFTDMSNIPQAWSERVNLARSALDSDPKYAASVSGMYWESALGFWLLSGGNTDEALKVISHNLAAWKSALPTHPDDPWLAQLQAMQACAVVRSHLAHPTGPDHSDELKDAQAVLLKEDVTFGHARDSDKGNLFAPPEEGTALHQLVLRTLIDLYSSPLASSKSQRDHYRTRLSNYVLPANLPPK